MYLEGGGGNSSGGRRGGRGSGGGVRVGGPVLGVTAPVLLNSKLNILSVFQERPLFLQQISLKAGGYLAGHGHLGLAGGLGS